MNYKACLLYLRNDLHCPLQGEWKNVDQTDSISTQMDATVLHCYADPNQLLPIYLYAECA